MRARPRALLVDLGVGDEEELDPQLRALRAARAAGLAALRWTGPQDIPYLRAALGS